MTGRIHYLVTYDIGDDDRHGDVSLFPSRNGPRVQLSVFEVELANPEIAATFRNRLTAFAAPTTIRCAFTASPATPSIRGSSSATGPRRTRRLLDNLTARHQHHKAETGHHLKRPSQRRSTQSTSPQLNDMIGKLCDRELVNVTLDDRGARNDLHNPSSDSPKNPRGHKRPARFRGHRNTMHRLKVWQRMSQRPARLGGHRNTTIWP